MLRVGRIGFWYRLAIVVVRPLLRVFTRHEWHGLENIPATGGVIVAANHISYVDPLALAECLLYGRRRVPRFLAKSTLFDGTGLVARVVKGAGQIPVHRRTADASLALRDAVEALARGECVVIYPEGTVSRDPDKWPMRARTGVARLALLSGAPVVPLGQWGAQEILDSYRGNKLRLLPRKCLRFQAGPPVDLGRYHGQDLTAQVLRAATDEVMAAVTGLVEALRGEPAPAAVFNPAVDGTPA